MGGRSAPVASAAHEGLECVEQRWMVVEGSKQRGEVIGRGAGSGELVVEEHVLEPVGSRRALELLHDGEDFACFGDGLPNFVGRRDGERGGDVSPGVSFEVSEEFACSCPVALGIGPSWLRYQGEPTDCGD